MYSVWRFIQITRNQRLQPLVITVVINDTITELRRRSLAGGNVGRVTHSADLVANRGNNQVATTWLGKIQNVYVASSHSVLEL